MILDVVCLMVMFKGDFAITHGLHINTYYIYIYSEEVGCINGHFRNRFIGGT